MSALIASWRRCTGCRACELACARLGRRGTSALALATLGPWRLPDGRGLIEHLPVVEAGCHLCAPRRRRGLLPACVAHCPTRCLALVDDPAPALAQDGPFPWLVLTRAQPPP